ncbi:MAG: isoleucine--tRNA ligase [Phycisphaerae bacterium]|nr:isoleucine--tRNA ligase [Phycisphaerae bacterium]
MSDKEKNYKDTLNLPKTSFDMRAGLLKKEPAIQQKWRQEKLYEHIRAAREGAARFILHDGPPYANGNIHMGTALNKVLKDMVVRIRTMSGMDAPYVPGWDCHGLPIEAKVMDEIGQTARNMDAMEIRRRCRAYAQRFAGVQAEQFQRLGVMGLFDRPYITMDPQYEADTLEVFARLVEQGLVHKQLKPVHWSIENRTALADAELEYHDREDPSMYLALPVAGRADPAWRRDDEELYLLIWTTTPWTLPGNVAVAVHPNFTYSFVHVETARGPATYVVAEGRLNAAIQAIKAGREGYIKRHKVIATAKGTQLIKANVTYKHPLFEGKTCPVVPADYVTLEDGTGLVHTAPGHGLEDYTTGLKYGLEIYCPVQEDGTFDQTVPDWLRGLSVWDANGRIVERLEAAGLLVLAETVTHSYPHDWRSKTPTIFRATEQWFISVDRELPGSTDTLRKLAVDFCRREGDDGLTFVPAWGRNRILGMLESRPDWCISRQRSWGLPIPVFYNESGEALLTKASVRAVARVVAEKGSDAWFSLSPAELLAGYDPADDKDLAGAEDFPAGKLTKGTDIFDVWFESGSSWFAAAIATGLVDDIPVDLYLEGSDQHRGWFQLSLLPALGACGKPPFRAVLTHGFVVTEEGHKMSKSLGNAVDVVEQLAKRGADILRLWIASQNYQDDVRCSENLIAQTEDAYRKVRNTLRFCMGACFDFDPTRHAIEPASHSVDRWMRLELHRLIRDVRQAYDRYEFHRAARLMYEFCTVQASSVYLSALKDRLYCQSPGAPRRRASQTVIHEMLVALVKLLAPILPHTCEEAWEHIPFRPSQEPHSVHLASLPDYDADALATAEELRAAGRDLAALAPDELQAGPEWIWDRLLEIRQASLVKLEALRNAGVKNPLDAEVVFKVRRDDDAVASALELYLRELEDMLGVGYARIERTAEVPEGQVVGVEVLDSRQKYSRCARSWKRRPDVGSDSEYPDLSARDAAVMREIAP